MRIEAEIDAVRVLVATLLDREKLSGAQLKDLRDILAELRGLQVKAEKGRRKDLKKIEILVGDLLLITEKW